MDKNDEENIDLSMKSGIKFGKYAIWMPVSVMNIVYNPIICESGMLLCVNHYFEFPAFKQQCVLLYGSIITLELGWTNRCLNKKTRLSVFLPPGGYEKNYNYCCMNSELKTRTLKEVNELKSEKIIIRFNSLETHLKSSGLPNWENVLKQQITEIIQTILIKIKKDEHLKSIKIYTMRSIRLKELLDAALRKSLCYIYIYCECDNNENCFNKIQYDSDYKYKRIVFLIHRY